MPGLPILTYHAVDASGSVVSVAPDELAGHLRLFADRGLRTIGLDEAVRALRTGAVPDDAVVLTFDDGYESVYTEAFPLLERFGATATVFLIADHVGRHNDWPGHVSPVGRQPLMSWAQVAEMQRAGHRFEAHTCTHPDLTRLAPGAARDELRRGQAILEDRLGAAVRHLAYPYGYADRTVRALAAASFDGAVTTRLGTAWPGDDPYALRRLDAYYLRAPGQAARFGTRRLEAELRARQWVRDVRTMLRP